MNSRERVQAVLNHEKPDKIPNGLGGCETAGLHVLAYERLQGLMARPYAPPRLDTFMCNAVFEPDVLSAMEGDILLLASPRMCKSQLRVDQGMPWRNESLWGHSIRVPAGERFHTREDGSIVWESQGGVICLPDSHYFDCAATADLNAAFAYPSPDEYHPPSDFPDEQLRQLEEAAKRMYEETEFCLCLGETITDLQIAPGGTIGSMALMMEQPDIMHAFLHKSVEAGLSQLVLLEQALGKYVDILSIAHDFGDNQGFAIGEALWRSIYKPHYMRLFQGWKQRTRMRINLHSCGAISSILGDLIECGVDVINPVQTSAQGMDPETLIQRFGGDIVFWGGGYDAQSIPANASFEQVYRSVRHSIEAFKPYRYIFSGVHNLPSTTSKTHLHAMLEAYRDTRYYGE